MTPTNLGAITSDASASTTTAAAEHHRPADVSAGGLRLGVERLDEVDRPRRLHVNVAAAVAVVAVARLVEGLTGLRLVLRVPTSVGAQLGEAVGEEAPGAVRAGALLAVVHAQLRLVARLLVVAVVQRWGRWWEWVMVG